ELGDRVLAGDDDVVAGAAGRELGEQLVVRGVEGLLDARGRVRRLELRERAGRVVLRPVVDDEVALHRLAGQGVAAAGRRAGTAAATTTGVGRAAAGRGNQPQRAETEELAPRQARPLRRIAIELAVEVVELRLRARRRQDVERVAGLVGHCVSF